MARSTFAWITVALVGLAVPAARSPGAARRGSPAGAFPPPAAAERGAPRGAGGGGLGPVAAPRGARRGRGDGTRSRSVRSIATVSIAPPTS